VIDAVFSAFQSSASKVTTMVKTTGLLRHDFRVGLAAVAAQAPLMVAQERVESGGARNPRY
jgi:hypothetical protein